MTHTMRFLDSSGNCRQVVIFRENSTTVWSGEERTLATHRVVVGFICIVEHVELETCMR